MFTLEDMRLTSDGRRVSDGFYGGRHTKYRDMIVINPFPKYAYGFTTEEDAQKTADFYNKRGYNFVVRNRQ